MTRPRRVLRVQFGDHTWAAVSGHGSRALLVELRGKPPMWSSTARAWLVQARTGRDVVAMAEARGWAVEVIEDDHL